MHFPYLTPSQIAPPGVSWGQFVQPVSIPRFTCIICAKWIPNRSSRLTTFPRLLSCWPPKSPLPKLGRGVSWGELAYVHFQMNPQTCTEFAANRSFRLAAFPDFWICDTLPPPPPPPRNTPWGIEGRLVFSPCLFPDESADMNQSWCQWASFPRLLNWWPPKTPQVPPCVLRAICLAYIQSHMNLHMCAKLGANRPSRLVAFPEFFFPKVQTSTSLTFFTANFVAFSGALAEVLMIFCRPACNDWIVYIDTMISYVHMPNRCEAPLLQMARRILSDLPEAGHPMATGRGDRLTTGKHHRLGSLLRHPRLGSDCIQHRLGSLLHHSRLGSLLHHPRLGSDCVRSTCHYLHGARGEVSLKKTWTLHQTL